MSGWDFRVRGFAGGRHPNGVPAGTLLVETTHKGESSAFIEIEAWKARMRRGEVSRVELIDLRPSDGRGRSLTNMSVYEHTDIPWSHTR